MPSSLPRWPAGFRSLVGRSIPTVSIHPQRRRPSPSQCKVGATLDVSRPARRSRVLRPVGSPSRQAARLSRRLRRFRYLHHRSDSYRLERPSCRVGIAPTEDQHLSTAHTGSVPAKPPSPYHAPRSIGGRPRKPFTGPGPAKPPGNWNKLVIRQVFLGLRGRNQAVLPRFSAELDV
jgi:hypothetical protein